MSSWGTEIGFRPASLYQCGEKPFSFVDVMREARRQNELAIGYVYEEDGAEKVVLNPSFADRQATNPDIRKIAVLIEKINGGPQSQFLI